MESIYYMSDIKNVIFGYIDEKFFNKTAKDADNPDQFEYLCKSNFFKKIKYMSNSAYLSKFTDQFSLDVLDLYDGPIWLEIFIK